MKLFGKFKINPLVLGGILFVVVLLVVLLILDITKKKNPPNKNLGNGGLGDTPIPVILDTKSANYAYAIECGRNHKDPSYNSAGRPVIAYCEDYTSLNGGGKWMPINDPNGWHYNNFYQFPGALVGESDLFCIGMDNFIYKNEFTLSKFEQTTPPKLGTWTPFTFTGPIIGNDITSTNPKSNRIYDGQTLGDRTPYSSFLKLKDNTLIVTQANDKTLPLFSNDGGLTWYSIFSQSDIDNGLTPAGPVYPTIATKSFKDVFGLDDSVIDMNSYILLYFNYIGNHNALIVLPYNNDDNYSNMNNSANPDTQPIAISVSGSNFRNYRSSMLIPKNIGNDTTLGQYILVTSPTSEGGSYDFGCKTLVTDNGFTTPLSDLNGYEYPDPDDPTKEIIKLPTQLWNGSSRDKFYSYQAGVYVSVDSGVDYYDYSWNGTSGTLCVTTNW
jgi:hypothetical protein